jgi:hypothetical protein
LLLYVSFVLVTIVLKPKPPDHEWIVIRRAATAG